MSRQPHGQLVEREFLTLPIWDQLDAVTCEHVARAVERGLPDPWRFTGLRWHECGDQRRNVATFDWNGSVFTLIPGGPCTLGYDRARPFEPTMDQSASYEFTRQEYGTPLLTEWLAEYMTELRTATIRPMLVEVSPRAVPNNVQNLLKQDEESSRPFRPPTVDEWEYLSGGGSRTLWRWGNDCPTDSYPYDESKNGIFKPVREPNAFGLYFPTDGYQTEGVYDTRWSGLVPRCGDGGGLTCGGAGFFVAWLLLATAFDPKSLIGEDEFDGVVRRVLQLPDVLFG